MDNNSADNNFQNSFPVNSNANANKNGKTDDGRNRKGKRNLSVLNVGQILLLIILFVVLCLQALNLLFNPVRNITIEPLQNGADYRQAEIPEAAGADYADYQKEPAGAPDNGIISEMSPAEPEVIFILGESNGKLAILSPDRRTVYETFSVYINTLPPLDRELLLEGIRITTTEELGSLLEDFSS
jgi:hypothetical protein